MRESPCEAKAKVVISRNRGGELASSQRACTYARSIKQPSSKGTPLNGPSQEIAVRNAKVEEQIKGLAKVFADQLKRQIDDRSLAMEEDDTSHRLIYRVLGITDEEGRLIDLYQNKGRFLYKYAGALLESAAILCFESKFPDAKAKVKVDNPLGTRPRRFEIDCLLAKDALEIKWRDATTDGDHITKEHARIKAISAAGFKPIRVMFYYPNREQAIRIQETLKTLYAAMNGDYYSGDEAWRYIQQTTDIDLMAILTRIAENNTGKA